MMPLRDIGKITKKIGMLTPRLLLQIFSQLTHRSAPGRLRELDDASLEEIRKKDFAGLSEYDLRQADLTSLDFGTADCSRVCFNDANLSHSDLHGVNNLEPVALQGANLTLARLPETLTFNLDIISEYIKTCRVMFLTLLGAVGYAILAAVSTRDVDLLTGARDFVLPIVNTQISLSGFYSIGPALIFSFGCFFYLNVNTLFGRLAQLPAFLPSGGSLDGETQPWVPLELIRVRLPLLRGTIDLPSLLRCTVGVLLAWSTVPIAMITIWLSYLKRQEPNLTYLHVTLFALSIFVSFVSFVFCCTAEKRVRTIGVIVAAIICVTLTSPVLIASIVILKGGPPPVFAETIMRVGGYSPTLSLVGAEISQRPSNWSPALDPTFDEVTGADLSHSSLRRASGNHAFFARAVLTQTDLSEADFTRGRFQYADFTGASAVRARFTAANFSHAHLHSANFSFVEAPGANFDNAIMKNSDFSHAILENATFREANLDGANLAGTYLNGAEFLEVSMRNADLTGASLFGVHLSGNVTGSNLKGADVRRADLRDAVGLNQQQINSACLDIYTAIPNGLIWSGDVC